MRGTNFSTTRAVSKPRAQTSSKRGITQRWGAYIKGISILDCRRAMFLVAYAKSGIYLSKTGEPVARRVTLVGRELVDSVEIK